MKDFLNNPRVKAVGLLLIPASILSIVLCCFVVGWRLIRSDRPRALRLETVLAAETASVSLEQYLETGLRLVGHFRDRWAEEKIDSRDTFTEIALPIEDEFLGFGAIAWVDTEGIIRWIVPWEENQAAEGRDLMVIPQLKTILDLVVQFGRPRATAPRELFAGGRGFIAYFPVRQAGQAGKPAGFLAGVFRIDLLTKNVLAKGLEDDFHVRITDGDHEVYASAGEVESPVLVQRPFRVLDRVWTLSLSPTAALIQTHSTRNEEFLMVVAFLLGLGLAGFLVIVFGRQAKILLEKETEEKKPAEEKQSKDDEKKDTEKMLEKAKEK